VVVDEPVRLLRPDDARELAVLRRENQEFLQPWEPIRDASFLTEEGQRRVVERHLAECEAGTGLSLVVLDAGRVVGMVNLTGIVRGPFLSANLGYWVAESANGRGLATAAVGATLDLAFGELGLHRVQAATLPHNHRSQRVLERNGFERIGYAPEYLRIDGRWQDHVLFQVIAPG
jgi:ribosomal-protein-alanine N-acetyltransferase